jgi:dihydroflavonol-4-reductase
MVTSEKPIAVLTGVTGYLGSQILNTFLNGEVKDLFRIRATVRNKDNQAKMKPLVDFFGQEALDRVEFVNADLMNEASLFAAIEGATYVVHSASPVAASGDSGADLIAPAINGALGVLRACAKHGVKRLVITSSISSACAQREDRRVPFYNETFWSDEEWIDDKPYFKGKTLAEKAVWDFQRDS